MARSGLTDSIHDAKLVNKRKYRGNYLRELSGAHGGLYYQANLLCCSHGIRLSGNFFHGVNSQRTWYVSQRSFYLRMSGLSYHVHGIALLGEKFCSSVSLLYKRTGCVKYVNTAVLGNLLFLRSYTMSAQQ